jgi:uncharacterized protein (TIGR00369 family)
MLPPMTALDDGLRARFREGNPYARVRLPNDPRLGGGVAGSVHGGVLAALADIATLAAMTTVFTPDERAAGTAELSISYLRPALGAHVAAEARVLKKGRTLAVIDVDLKDADDRLVAKARVSYALRPAGLAEPPGRQR